MCIYIYIYVCVCTYRHIRKHMYILKGFVRLKDHTKQAFEVILNIAITMRRSERSAWRAPGSFLA